MTTTERLQFEACAVQIEMLIQIAHATQAYTDGRPHAVLEQIKATLDSATADEIDALR